MNYMKNRGFTLVEIVFVIAITALMMAIAIPNLVKARRQHQRDTCIENLRKMEKAKHMWVLNNMQKTNALGFTENEIFGKDELITSRPICPSGGKYTLGTVTVNAVVAACTKSGPPHYHVLP